MGWALSTVSVLNEVLEYQKGGVGEIKRRNAGVTSKYHGEKSLLALAPLNSRKQEEKWSGRCANMSRPLEGAASCLCAAQAINVLSELGVVNAAMFFLPCGHSRYCN